MAKAKAKDLCCPDVNAKARFYRFGVLPAAAAVLKDYEPFSICVLPSRPAIAGKPRRSVYKLWRTYKFEKRASNVTALTSTNDHLTVIRHYVYTKCKIMQHLGVNFGGIWRFELEVFLFFFA